MKNIRQPIVRALCVSAALLSFSGCASLSGSFPTSLKAVEKSQPVQRQLNIEKWQTANGARVLFVPSPTLPMLDIRLVFDAGSARDGGSEGIAKLTSALFAEGAADKSVDDIARGFEDLGAQFNSASYRDMAVLELRTLTDPEFFSKATDLFSVVAGQPSFPQASLQRIRQQMLIGLKREKQVPGPQVSRALNEIVFGDHPYAHDSSGTESSLLALSRTDVQAYYKTFYAAQNAVIAMTGDLTLDEAKALAEKISAALPNGERAPALPRATAATTQNVKHLPFESSQTILLLGEQSIWRGHPDWVPLYVGNQILGGGGFASILTEEVREKRGFVYGIGSGISPMAAAGPFMVQLQTANENADEALAVTLKLVSDFVKNGPTSEQLESARESIIGSFALTAAENDEIVGQLGAIGFYDLPLDYLTKFENEVRTVTVEQVREAFQRNIHPENLAIVSIGPKAPKIPADENAPDDKAAQP